MKIKIQLIVVMLLFGSLGLFVQGVDMPSAAIVQWRAILGFVSLMIAVSCKKHKVNFVQIRKNGKPLLIAGLFLGIQWALLFEAYQDITVGLATIIYYFAPIFVFFLTPVIFKQKLTTVQVFGILAAAVGMLLVNLTNITSIGFSKGVVYAFVAALMYATIVISNQFMENLDSMDSTLVQLCIAMVVMTIYCFVSSGQLLQFSSGEDMLKIFIVGIIHTGFAYALYFHALQHSKPQDIAVFSYIDPASALVFAFLFLGENLIWYQIIGACLIFGGSLYPQIYELKKT